MAAKLRNIRVEDETWARAMATAKAQGTNLSVLINAYLNRLAYPPEPTAERVASPL